MPENLSDLLWGPYTALAIIMAGLYLGIKTRFFYMRHPLLVFKETLGKLLRKPGGKGSVSPFQAMSIALGGTMGTGNITGVATAIAMGGPGAVMWMWLSAMAGMVLKYAETVLAMDTRIKGRDGYEGSPMQYMKLVPGAGILSILFAAALLCAAFFGGNMVQTNAAAAMGEWMGVPPLATGLAIGVVVLVLSFGGIKSVADALSLLVPFMTVAYLGASGWAIYQGREAIGELIVDMVTSAFGLRQLTGGLTGYTVSQALRYGMARGLFSNEAGFGTAPIDTIICCTATAIVVLLVPEGLDPALSGAQITAGAFGALIGPVFEGMVAIFTIIFALTSILGWYVYGEAAVKVLIGPHKWVITLYRFIYGGTCVIGAVMMPGLAWQLTDIASWLMMVINLPIVLILASRISRVTDQYLREIENGRDKKRQTR